MKNIENLISNNELWLNIKDQIEKYNKATLCLEHEIFRNNVIAELGVSTETTLGAVIYNTGAIVTKNKIIRILCSGNDSIKRSIITWNKDENGHNKIEKALLVADDIFGGFFALNFGAFEGEMGNIYYLSPDTLEWEDLDFSYTDFINWVVSGDTASFYVDMLWYGWEDYAEKINYDQGILIYPFLWAEGDKIENRSKQIVPIKELWQLTLDSQNK